MSSKRKYLLCLRECGLPALAEVTGEGPFVTVAELDVDLQGGQSGAGHVTQRTLDVIHCKGYRTQPRVRDRQGRAARLRGKKSKSRLFWSILKSRLLKRLFLSFKT